MSINMFNF